MTRRLILKNWQSPGDIVMLTAAVRDLHLSHPGQFVTDVRTPCPALWQNNPYITPLRDDDPNVETIRCEYPLIHRSNELPYHFIHAFRLFLEERLAVRIRPTAFRGDIHLTREEEWSRPHIYDHTPRGTRYWIIVAGGKYDFTAKWWCHHRYQEVVDKLRGDVVFVQVGERGHNHPSLDGVIDLRGKTDLRQLILLVYHADGVVCPVTLHMHLAAAVQTRKNAPPLRPCVVIAGGREPAHWEQYPGHQFLHTIGKLPCCATGGCWRDRTKPLNDGDPKDRNLCLDVRRHLPACMDMITSDMVVEHILSYYQNGVLRRTPLFQPSPCK